MIPGRTESSAPTRHQEPAAPLAAPPLRTSYSPSVGADAYIGPTGFFPHPRQGTQALPYKALRYRARADRVVRPYKSATGGAMWASPPTRSMKVQPGGASGKSAKRRQWRKKRADFEEVPRLAGTTVAGNRLA